MLTPYEIYKQINTLTSDFIQNSISDDQTFPAIQKVRGVIEINFGNGHDFACVLKEEPYKCIYDTLKSNRAYNIRMLDGALIQISYTFKKNTILKHRLAFYPSPYLATFQEEPELYLNEVLYADIMRKAIVAFPVRFDFDSSDKIHKVIDHPKSHLTLGEYENCRIPVSSPLTPAQFISFIIRNFYHTVHCHFCSKLSTFNTRFSDTIHNEEEKVIHIRVP